MAKKTNDAADAKATKKDAVLHKTKGADAKGKGKTASKTKDAGKGAKKPKGDDAKQIVRMVPSTLGSHALSQINVHRKHGNATDSILTFVRLEVDKIARASLFNKRERKTVQVDDFEEVDGAADTAIKRAAMLAIEAKKPAKPKTKKAAAPSKKDDAPAPKKQKAAAPKKADEDKIEVDEDKGDDAEDDGELVDADAGEDEEEEPKVDAISASVEGIAV